ncbi:unnamed protein product [Rotaria magnacalcarata]|nr:unnamed protein product [Rotaria magnacalcarata]
MRAIVFFVSIVSILASEKCPAGFYCQTDTKAAPQHSRYVAPLPCPPGSFSGIGEDHCTPCAVGYYASKSGSTVCTECPAGFMCEKADQNPVLCPLGTYSACTGKSCCSTCPAGTYTPSTGSIECIRCPSGSSCPTSVPPSCGELC